MGFPVLCLGKSIKRIITVVDKNQYFPEKLHSIFELNSVSGQFIHSFLNYGIKNYIFDSAVQSENENVNLRHIKKRLTALICPFNLQRQDTDSQAQRELKAACAKREQFQIDKTSLVLTFALKSIKVATGSRVIKAFSPH